MTRTLLLSLLALIASGCRTDTPEFSQISYFKDARKNRVFVLQPDKVVTPDQVREHAASQPHTPGRFTAVFVYPQLASAPADPITLQPDFLAAQTMMMDSESTTGWRWYYLHQLNGNIVFRDCLAEPETEPGDLCNR